MSEIEGIDQQQPHVDEADEAVPRLNPENDQVTLSTNETIGDTTIDDNDVSMEVGYSVPNRDFHEVNKHETNDDDEEGVAKIDTDSETFQSRELKLLLALSKEANLDTNIPRKRKVLPLRKKVKSDSRNSLSKGVKVQYPVTAESELEMEVSTEGTKLEPDVDSVESSPTSRAAKKKKRGLSETSTEGFGDDGLKKSRKSLSSDIIMFKPNKDMFCWRCHKENVNISCETCPRSYHQKCLKQTITDLDHWPCPECVSILKAESTQSRSPAMKGMTLEHLCSLLKFAVNRMIQCQGSEPFIHEVSDAEFPDYKKYIIQPMDLTLLEKNIRENVYGSPQAFEADAKWILHNSIIFNSYQSKLTSVAKTIIKICKQEMSEIENCPSCYLNANTKKKTWFVEVCPKPHLLVWAKLRGFPFWPGKAMSCKDGNVDVRFFGAHDRAWVPEKECFLYTPKDPNLFRAKRADIEQCVQELEQHVKNLKKVFGEFNYPPFKTPIDSRDEVGQLQLFLPKYVPVVIKDVRESDDEKCEKTSKKHGRNKSEEENMEGYGTDDESIGGIDTEVRKNLLKSSEGDDSLEAEDDDTQVPANIEADTDGSQEVLTKGDFKSNSEPPSKRSSFEGFPPRRNSESKTDSIRINRVNIPENMEISLGNSDNGPLNCLDNVSSSNSECSSDFSVELRKKPIQVDVDNVEFTISPARKLKMADKLMKRLSDGESSSVDSAKIESVKRDITESEKSTKTWKVTDVNLKSEVAKLVIKAVRNDDKNNGDTDDKIEDRSIKEVSEEQPTSSVTQENLCCPDKISIESEIETVADKTESEKSPVSTSNDPEPNNAKADTTSNLNDSATIEPSKPTNSKDRAEPKKTNKRLNEDSDQCAQEPQKKVLKLVAVDKTSNSNNSPSASPSILKSSLEEVKKVHSKSTKGSPRSSTVNLIQDDVKIEPESEDSTNDCVQDLEAKKKYLSALNILEKGEADAQKPKNNEIRTRSKTEEKRERIRTGKEPQNSNNTNKNLEDATTSSNAKKKTINPSAKGDSAEIYVKSFAKIDIGHPLVPTPPSKQRARKSFPQPNYTRSVQKPASIQPAISKETLPQTVTPQVSDTISRLQVRPAAIATSSPINSPIVASSIAKAAPIPALQQLEAMRPTNGYLILQPQQLGQQQDNVVFLPQLQTTTLGGPSIANQVMSVTPCLVSAPTTNPAVRQLTQPQLWTTNQVETLNGTENDQSRNKRLLNGLSENSGGLPIVADGAPVEESNTGENGNSSNNNNDDDDLTVLNNVTSEGVNRVVSDIVRKAPPKLKPRPPGVLSQNFSEGIPSSAGPVASKINSVAHRLGDYFRGLLVETLEDLSKCDNPEATISSLKLEIETLKHKHRIELSEVEKNVSTMLKDIQKSIVDDRERIIQETRAACESETIKRVEEAKSKQWCTTCLKEAQFYCCWNTSYCDYPCQQKDWPNHMSKCTQNASQTGQVGPPATIRPGAQQLILRPANPPPKGGIGVSYYLIHCGSKKPSV
ncbi:hypothetical protein ABEB36_013042 [Hypothenemus hampei]|uniref:Protein kinase C-binding protein 1 n=1 Tax=Hypothenemus hampei TaxID=57062 RepID=A0ABD1E6M2_HYPHA